ncbi:hypothetical protein Syun_009496 [Stephania yunnanensis]|uniref:Uncharacterized protein n=1 Tax=Stephania yunnanensis TaxID=152371 RepID=A0AAP0KH37_9MAGN
MKISCREVKFGHEFSVRENPGRNPGIVLAKPRGTHEWENPIQTPLERNP